MSTALAAIPPKPNSETTVVSNRAPAVAIGRSAKAVSGNGVLARRTALTAHCVYDIY